MTHRPVCHLCGVNYSHSGIDDCACITCGDCGLRYPPQEASETKTHECLECELKRHTSEAT